MIAPMAATLDSSLIQLAASLLINAISGKGVMRQEMTRRGISCIISIAFNDGSSGKKSHKCKKKI